MCVCAAKMKTKCNKRLRLKAATKNQRRRLAHMQYSMPPHAPPPLLLLTLRANFFAAAFCQFSVHLIFVCCSCRCPRAARSRSLSLTPTLSLCSAFGCAAIFSLPTFVCRFLFRASSHHAAPQFLHCPLSCVAFLFRPSAEL